MHRDAIKRRKNKSKSIKQRENSFTYTYNVYGEDQKVCQQFFLRTLGFKSNRVLLTISQKAQGNILPAPDQRGKSSPKNKCSDEVVAEIQAHIMSYDPRISHYRRSHAPRRTLSSS